MPVFFVPSSAIAPPTIRIAEPLLRHLKNSLRLQPGESLTVTDHAGTRYRATVTQITAKALDAQIIETSPAPPRTAPTLVLAQALLKGDKMDWVIQKATELGVDRIIPMHTKHGVVKTQPDRVEHQKARWERIALEAAQQSERWTLPTIDQPVDLKQLVRQQANAATKIILSERSHELPLMKARLTNNPRDTIVVVIGPEGGWDEGELRQAEEAGFQAVTIGQRILRAETATVAAVSIVQGRLGELG
ncbi:MAG TPA: 16S rRNA (uracil(1498)-N(3))-methyltransferase [Nitrospira sp.]